MSLKKRHGLRGTLLTGAVLLACTLHLSAQTTTTKKKSDSDSDTSPRYSVGVFGGVQVWHLRQQNAPYPDILEKGGTFGIRADQDIWRYVGLEEQWTVYSVNNLRLRPFQPSAVQTIGFGARNGQVYVGPLFYLTPRETPIRPFFTVGPGFQYFWPTDDAGFEGRKPPLNAGQIDSRNGPALIFGGGIKAGVSPRFGIRADVHGILTRNEHFNLSGVPTGPGSVFIQPGGKLIGVQATLGFDFRWHRPEKPPEPWLVCPDGEKVKSLKDCHKICPGGQRVLVDDRCPPLEMQVTVSAVPTTVCAGELVNVSATTTPSLPNASYQWSVNGENLSTAKVLQFGTTGRSAGNYQIGVTVSAPDYNNGTGSTSVTVREHQPPHGTVSATPNLLVIKAGTPIPTSTLSANFTGQCGEPIGPASFRASEGTVNGNIYDGTTVQFDGGTQKEITITATATDAKGGSGTATTTIIVRRDIPPNKRLPDLIFARGSARINNCGKHLLLEELKAEFTQDPTGQVIFVGHTDEKEPKIKDLDLKRALNAAAVISAGKGICLNFAPTQILIGAAGNDQGAADFKPYFCETSATPVHERPGQKITADDKRAQFRRVEIWFVPTGGTMPPSASGYKTAADLDVAKLGCPK